MPDSTTSGFNEKRSVLVYAIVVAIILLDQISKLIVKKTMVLYDSVPVLGSFLKLTYIENSGMAFGIQMQNRILFTLLSIVATVVVCIYLVRISRERLFFRLSLALILGGAIGNLIDRIFHGRVVDFIDVEFFDIAIPQFDLWFIHFPGYALTRWPVFNIADSAVTCGLILLTALLILQRDPVQQELST